MLLIRNCGAAPCAAKKSNSKDFFSSLLVGSAFGDAATGAAAAAFAALTFAQRAFVASAIRLLPAALSLRFFFGGDAGFAFTNTGAITGSGPPMTHPVEHR
jgi:hypothetical protein